MKTWGEWSVYVTTNEIRKSKSYDEWKKDLDVENITHKPPQKTTYNLFKKWIKNLATFAESAAAESDEATFRVVFTALLKELGRVTASPYSQKSAPDVLTSVTFAVLQRYMETIDISVIRAAFDVSPRKKAVSLSKAERARTGGKGEAEDEESDEDDVGDDDDGEEEAAAAEEKKNAKGKKKGKKAPLDDDEIDFGALSDDFEEKS